MFKKNEEKKNFQGIEINIVAWTPGRDVFKTKIQQYTDDVVVAECGKKGNKRGWYHCKGVDWIECNAQKIANS